MQHKEHSKGKTSTLITLIIAAETIYMLPFVLVRVFRPTLLELFGISNTELGLWFSVYGIVAMVSYLAGGPLADRFPARKLMAWALWLTSAGGVLMSLVPSSRIMLIVYAFWGFSTICLFWSAMIRATREWGGIDFQGRAFGWLEGGRGTVAALIATLSFLIFSQIGSLRWVILTTSAMTLLSGILVWVFIPQRSPERSGTKTREVIREVSSLLRMRNTWLLSIIVLCAYIGYKITDDFSLFAREVLGFSEVHSAGIGTIALWIRALVAILTGYLADRFKMIDMIVVSFALTLAGGLLLGLGISDGVTSLLLLNLTFTAVGIYGIRALYFAVMKEAKIPVGLTGTAVGIISIVGFAPDIFIGPWMGYLLDRSPGAAGHAHVFMLLSAFALAGLVTALLFRRSVRS